MEILQREEVERATKSVGRSEGVESRMIKVCDTLLVDLYVMSGNIEASCLGGA